jgi:hypothetical protein
MKSSEVSFQLSALSSSAHCTAAVDRQLIHKLSALMAES